MKRNVLPRLLYLFQALPFWISLPTFQSLDKAVSKVVWQGKRPKIWKKVLCSVKRKGGLGLPNFKIGQHNCKDW